MIRCILYNLTKNNKMEQNRALFNVQYIALLSKVSYERSFDFAFLFRTNHCHSALIAPLPGPATDPWVCYLFTMVTSNLSTIVPTTVSISRYWPHPLVWSACHRRGGSSRERREDRERQEVLVEPSSATVGRLEGEIWSCQNCQSQSEATLSEMS